MYPTKPGASLWLIVNGTAAEVSREPDRRLLDVLHDELGVTGPRPGCGEGVSGACSAP